MRNKIKVEVSNLPNRADRLEYVKSVLGKHDFLDVSYNTPVEGVTPDNSILRTIASYVTKNYTLPYFVYVEDDVVLTEHFNEKSLRRSIEWMQGKADILLGGVASLRNISTSLYDLPSNVVRVKGYRGSHFTVIYEEAYDTILRFVESKKTDLFENLFDNYFRVYTLHPFVATQRDFGYSDTNHAVASAKLPVLFERAGSKIDFLKTVSFVA